MGVAFGNSGCGCHLVGPHALCSDSTHKAKQNSELFAKLGESLCILGR